MQFPSLQYSHLRFGIQAGTTQLSNFTQTTERNYSTEQPVIPKTSVKPIETKEVDITGLSWLAIGAMGGIIASNWNQICKQFKN